MTSSPPLRLLFAFAASVLLHALLLSAQDFKRLLTAAPRHPVVATLQARLLPPTSREPLLKNTLSETPLAEPRSTEPLPARAALTPRARTSAAQRKLAEHLFYPPEAIARGLEGEVRLLLTLDSQGKVLEARIASSSGHALLDQAALDAAHALNGIPAAGASELILPVVFKLQ